MITEPGIYSMTAADYHADPCVPMSLSSTGARTLIQDCPAVFIHQRTHPVRKREFDIGNATHLLTLEPDQFAVVVVPLPFDDYRTKEARNERDAARLAGRIPLLTDGFLMVANMRDEIFNHPIAGQAFRDGKPEQSMFWKDEEFGVWCRTRPDYLPNHTRYIVDLKTAASSDPDDFARAAAGYGYHQQAAWYLDGVEAVMGARPEKFAFVVVGKTPPHLVTVCWLDREMIEWGRILNRRAKGVFAWCLRHGKWPGYQPELTEPPRAFTIGLPRWAVQELERKHEAGDFEPPAVEDMAE